jgi:hypothetical protein
LESVRVAVDVAVTTVRDERSRTRVVAAVRATVRRSRRPAVNESLDAAMEEYRRVAMGHGESPGVWTSERSLFGFGN